ncbi:MAG: ABATE domain-containing protein, partial [Actinophytocola sp.]|uniref:ABATE domain-containing protein n=1 Tax=Actinophytocola sp. TaxID=1872138 RepID=UPI003C786402
MNSVLNRRFSARTGVGPTVVAVADVDLVVDFLNTVDHEAHTDVLSDPGAWGRWLAGRGLADGADVRAVRTAL